MSPAAESKKVAVITGASGGIGAGLAAAFRDHRLRGRGHLAFDALVGRSRPPRGGR